MLLLFEIVGYVTERQPEYLTIPHDPSSEEVGKESKTEANKEFIVILHVCYR